MSNTEKIEIFNLHVNEIEIFNLYVNELEALVAVHKNEWQDAPYMPITLQKIGGTILAKIAAVNYAYDGKTWVRA